MEHPDMLMQPIAIICGSATAVGGALAARMHGSGMAVITIDFPELAAHPAAALRLTGDLAEERDWIVFAQDIQRRGLRPAMLAYAVSEIGVPATLPDLDSADWDRVVARQLRGAYLACKRLFPLMRRPSAAVLLATVLAGWDARADLAALSASSGGMLALANSLALSGAPLGMRVNTVCCPAPLPSGDDAIRRRALDRIPLGRATSPDDVVEAIMFLLSDDASYLTGSSLVVDGGQSLQSWSNAPDAPYSQL
jgi:NAD(P)-dependent dehydrogenase (short-subunit alcohol dehydrogenase family)